MYEVRGSEPVTDLSDADRRLVLEGVENAESRGLNVLDEASDFAAELGRDVETKLLHGDPVVEIADHAEEAGFDAIVVGHRGRSEHEDRLLGSVAKELVERATVPVTVVR